MPCCHLKRDLTRFLSDPFYGNVELVLTSHYSKCQCFVAIENSRPNAGNEPGVVWLVCKTQRACFYGRLRAGYSNANDVTRRNLRLLIQKCYLGRVWYCGPHTLCAPSRCDKHIMWGWTTIRLFFCPPPFQPSQCWVQIVVVM